MATKAQGNDCYEKAAEREPVFTLRAQDLTADTVVEFWAFLNGLVQQYIKDGLNPDAALLEVRALLRTVFYDRFAITYNQKIVDAQVCANEMRAWSRRKWAD